ncbi:MAG: response regulator [Candidatus Tectimicrobiota bacterium]
MPHVLVIDDNPMIRDLLRQMLERHGYNVHEATTGLEGLHAYRTVPTDVVITDLQMPDMDGLQMMQELHCAYPAIKIIAMSGAPGLLHQAHTLASHIFAKPLALRPLLHAVRELLEQN